MSNGIPVRIVGEERMAVVEVRCFDCVAEPVRFRWRESDLPTIQPKHLSRRCRACAAAARARKKKAAAEARRARDMEQREMGRQQVRRRLAYRQAERRKNLKSVPAHLRPKVADAAS